MSKLRRRLTGAFAPRADATHNALAGPPFASGPPRGRTPLVPDQAAVNKEFLLARHEFFLDMPPAAIKQLASHARLSTHAPRTQLFRKGDEGVGLYAVVSGVVKISATSDEGKEVVFNLIGANEVFGELALLDGGPRTANAEAVMATRLLSLDRRDFVAVLSQDASIAIRLLAILSSRLRQTSEQVEDLSFALPENRLAKALLRLMELQAARPDGEAGAIAATQQELGRMIGLSRESTNKLLKGWERLGWLTLRKGVTVVRNSPALLAVASAGTRN